MSKVSPWAWCMRFALRANPMTLLLHADPLPHLHSEPLLLLLAFAAVAAVMTFRRQRS